MKSTRLMTAALSLVAAGLSQAAEPKEQIEAFFTTVKAGEVDKAFETLLANSPIKTDSPDGVAKLKEQTKNIFSLYGEMKGFEQVGELTYGTCLKNKFYILKSVQLPIVWQFSYYNSGKEWTLINVRFNDKMDLLPPVLGVPSAAK